MKVKADGLADAIELEFQNYRDDVREGIAKSFNDIVSKSVRKLRETSPKRTGGYAKSWTKKVTVFSKGVTAIAYNKKFASLTHLLEHGHANAGGGRTSGIAHVGPVQEWASNEALKAVAEILEEG